jgi:uncharacterized protein (UPF0332 family)
LWERARRALATARRDLPADPDAAASRAYYAAFYAVSALFAAEGKSFRKHSAVETAVHRDLVHLAAAERILDAVRAAHPEEFGDPA